MPIIENVRRLVWYLNRNKLPIMRRGDHLQITYTSNDVCTAFIRTPIGYILHIIILCFTVEWT